MVTKMMIMTKSVANKQPKTGLPKDTMKKVVANKQPEVKHINLRSGKKNSGRAVSKDHVIKSLRKTMGY